MPETQNEACLCKGHARSGHSRAKGWTASSRSLSQGGRLLREGGGRSWGSPGSLRKGHRGPLGGTSQKEKPSQKGLEPRMPTDTQLVSHDQANPCAHVQHGAPALRSRKDPAGP